MQDKTWTTASFPTPLIFRYHLPLKVPSGQIGSVWEWYHYRQALKEEERTSTAVGFFIFLFHFWIFEKTSKFWAASYKNESNLLLLGITANWLKKSAKGLHYFGLAGCWFSSNILLTSRNPKHNCWLSRIFGARFNRIYTITVCAHNPWSQ